jgi:hypothetical protein
MKFKQLLTAIIILITTIFTGCKKENLPSGTATNQQDLISQTAKAWFGSQGPDIKNAGLQILGKGEPDWNNTAYYPNENIYITHIKLKDETVANKYLVEEADKNGKITNANYYIVLTKDNPATLEKPIEAHLFGKDQMPENFNGALLEYDLNNNVIFSKHYENGLITNEIDKLNFKQNAKNTKTGADPDLVNPNECGGETIQVCIDWYWQTWVNGELVYEEFLYTTCGCYATGGGGGGGTLTCEQQNQNFANLGNAIDGPITSMDDYNDGIIWIKSYNWGIYTAGTWGLLSYEKGTMEKKHYPNHDIWEYQSFTHTLIAEVGIVIGGTRTFTDLGATINISPSKTRVDVRIDFSVSSKISCFSNALTTPYNSNKTFYAPNTVIIGDGE